MNRARARRRYNRWLRYENRYIQPDTGGYLNNAMPIGAVKATLRLARMPWTSEDARLARIGRRSR